LIVDRRIVACVVLSVGAHVAFARAMRGLPKRADVPVTRVVSIRVVSPPPAPEPPPEPTHAEPAPKPVPAPVERPRARRSAPTVAPPTATQDVPPPEHAPAPSDTPGTPVFGVSMESTSQAGGGPSMAVGSPGGPREGHGGGAADAKGKGEGAAPVPVYEVTKRPLPQSHCAAKMPEEASRAGVEGLVVLDIVVGANGRVHDVRVVSHAGHGLEEAAVAAIKACSFSPAMRGDEAVAFRIPEFKYRFLQPDE
jgi:periplasmic protein TonB